MKPILVLNKEIIIALQLSLMLVSINVFSQTSEETWTVKILVEGGLENGGDRPVWNNGNPILRAGTGAYLAVGGQLELPKVKNLLFRASVGIRQSQTVYNNEDIRFMRFPVFLMPCIKVKEDFRLGIGLTSHMTMKLKGESRQLGLVRSFGPRYEFGYKWFSISYSLMRYISNYNPLQTAGSIGISASFVFPKK